MPIPDAEIPRGWVEAAREAIKTNKRPSNARRRFWPLSGGVLRCPACGWAMSPHTISPGGKSTRPYYYYRCSKHMKNSYDGCSNYRHRRAEELEERVWREVAAVLRDPDRLRAGKYAVIDTHRSAPLGGHEREAKAWLNKLAEVDRKRAKYQEMAAEELISLDELRGRLADLQDVRATAERKLEEVRGRAERIAELENDRDALLESYEALAPEELDDLTPEERHGFYRTLRVVVYVHPQGGVEITGEFVPFGPPDSDNPPGYDPGGSPGDNGVGPERTGGEVGPASRGFSTNINTRGSGGGARARRERAAFRRPGGRGDRRRARRRVGCRGPRPATRRAGGGGT